MSPAARRLRWFMLPSEALARLRAEESGVPAAARVASANSAVRPRTYDDDADAAPAGATAAAASGEDAPSRSARVALATATKAVGAVAEMRSAAAAAPAAPAAPSVPRAAQATAQVAEQVQPELTLKGEELLVYLRAKLLRPENGGKKRRNVRQRLKKQIAALEATLGLAPASPVSEDAAAAAEDTTVASKRDGKMPQRTGREGGGERAVSSILLSIRLFALLFCLLIYSLFCCVCSILLLADRGERGEHDDRRCGRRRRAKREHRCERARARETAPHTEASYAHGEPRDLRVGYGEARRPRPRRSLRRERLAHASAHPA